MSSDRLRIVQLGLKGLSLQADAGGIERHVAELAPRLVAQGHEVTAYVRQRYYDAGQPEYKGVKLKPLPSVPTKHLDTITHTWLAAWDVLRRPVDIIHYHGIGPATLSWITRWLKPSAQTVVTFHSLDRFHQKWGAVARAYLHFSEWAAVKFPHATITVSRGMQDYCRQHYRAETTHIPNGANLEPYPGSDRLAQWNLEPGSYFLTAARLVKQKGIHHLIEAYDGFESEKQLVIMGAGDEHPGSYADYLHRLSEGNSSIIFTGFQTGAALKQLIANCYLYIHPSEAEGLSVSILEAMAAGRGVLVSEIPENVEPIDHSGVSFVNANAADLRAKMRQLLNHPEIVDDLGQQGRRWIDQEYSWDLVAERTERFYFDQLDQAAKSRKS
jgi:glycosyltransferase involved in cell wall biosynthesis